MIVYSKTKLEFVKEVFRGTIASEIESLLLREVGIHSPASHIASYQNSMEFMRTILQDDPEIPDDVGVAIEYVIPNTSKRIDFIISGLNNEGNSTAVVIELKQWSEAQLTEMDGIVQTKLQGRLVDTNHPSYQALSYVSLLNDYNAYIQDSKSHLQPCAYLHNYSSDNILTDKRYKKYVDAAPIFFKTDRENLQNFIKKYVRRGDNGKFLYQIDNGEIRPSKHLASSMKNMLNGKQEFVLIDDQKIAFETCLMLANRSVKGDKTTIIIEGGPGTGKSVIAINLLSEFINQKPRNSAVYVTRNSAPRKVYQYMLSGSFTQNEISNLFMGSGKFIDAKANTFKVLIVDEAHRLNEKSGMFNNLGVNQIKEIVNASKCSIFFVDDNQAVTLKDIGEKAELALIAKTCGSKVHYLSLSSQFRCNGSDGYLAWLDNTLGIKETANYSYDNQDYFQVISSPKELHDNILKLNDQNNRSRVIAGYCWKWVSKKNPELYDINIDDYHARWNLDKHGQAWIVHPDSVSEVGCIHTTQGLELDYVGVIIGPDMVARNGQLMTDYTKRAGTDQSLKGLKAKIKTDPEYYEKKADQIIRNTYRTLLTRGMKGCFIYCTDPETQIYFKNRIQSSIDNSKEYTDIPTGISVTTDATRKE